jgi:hypothetical protein
VLLGDSPDSYEVRRQASGVVARHHPHLLIDGCEARRYVMSDFVIQH